jgi:hypothetical protein
MGYVFHARRLSIQQFWSMFVMNVTTGVSQVDVLSVPILV